MRRVDNNGINTSLHECSYALKGIVSNTDTSSHTQPTFLVLAGHGFILSLSNILIRNQSNEVILIVNHGKLLNFILLQYLRSTKEVCLHMSRHQVFAGHYLVDKSTLIQFKSQIAVGYDTHQMVLLVNDRNTTDMIFAHQLKGISNGTATANGHRVVNHTVFCPLHNSHLSSLFLDRHVLVNYANTTFTSYCYSHGSFGNSIHSS